MKYLEAESIFKGSGPNFAQWSLISFLIQDRKRHPQQDRRHERLGGFQQVERHQLLDRRRRQDRAQSSQKLSHFRLKSDFCVFRVLDLSF